MALSKPKLKKGRPKSAREYRAKADAARAAKLLLIKDALAYRIAGYTHEQIAGFLSQGRKPISRKTVSEWIREALAETIEEPSDQLRQIELDRLDVLFQTYWPGAIGAPDPSTQALQPPNTWHASMVLQITAMRWRLMGLGNPVQQIDLTSKGEQISQGTGLSGLLEAARAGKVQDAEVIEDDKDAGRRPDKAPGGK